VENLKGGRSFGSLSDMPYTLSQLVNRQCRLARRDQLRAVGLTPDELRAFVNGGRWVPLGPVVVAMHNGPLDRSQQIWAAVLASGKRARLAGLTALETSGLRNWSDPKVHVLIPRASGIAELPFVERVVHETRRVPRDGRSSTGFPLRVTVERAAIDAASWRCDTRSCCGLLAAVVQQRLTTAPRLMTALEAAGPIGHRRAMRLTIADIEGGAQALSEIDFGRLARKYQLGTVVRQVVRCDREGRRRYIDGEIIGPNGKRRLFEIDGAVHMLPENHWRDLERQNEMLIADDFPLRFSTYAMRFEELVVVDQTRRSLA
jgi:hypothetical protein